MQQFKAFEAPTRLVFPDPDTGREFKAATKEDLIVQIINYRKQNRLPEIERLGEVIDNYLCERPENVGKCKLCDYPQGFYGYLKGGLTLLKAVAFKHFATQEVAETRATQCVGCKFNSFPDHGPFITWLEELAVSCVGKKQVSKHDALGLCAVCQCPLRSKVFIDEKLPAFTKKQVESLKSVNCWQLKLSGQEDQ